MFDSFPVVSRFEILCDFFNCRSFFLLPFVNVFATLFSAVSYRLCVLWMQQTVNSFYLDLAFVDWMYLSDSKH